MKLHIRFSILVVTLIVISGILTSFLVRRQIIISSEEYLVEEGKIVSMLVSEMIGRSVIEEEVVYVKEVLTRIVEQTKEVDYIYIIGFDNRIFAHSFDRGVPKGIIKEIRSENIDHTGHEHYLLGSTPIINVSFPLIEGMRASVIVGLDESLLYSKLRKLEYQLLGIFGFVLIAGIPLVIFFSRFITRPINQLTQTLSDFGDGSNQGINSPRSTDPEISELISSFNDMAAKRKKVEETLNVSLKEQELLMKEMHHRVKNNLTVVSSLLKLQSAQVEDEHFKSLFNDSINRIRSISSIHDRLYKSDHPSKIIFSDYVKDIVNDLLRSYKLGSHLNLITDIEEITLGVDLSIPCGLIINELITNSIKHAFPATADRPEGAEDEIRISLHANETGEIELKVGDNGVGLPKRLAIEKTDSLGMILVNALVRQLKAKIKLNRENGTEFVITFKENKA
jgi:two-component sensor histidine kinase